MSDAAVRARLAASLTTELRDSMHAKMHDPLYAAPSLQFFTTAHVLVRQTDAWKE
jgi:hypothetical protein